ncbi:T9SS type A sorting domain-containing protein [Marinilabilia rubra]|uniref:T9SS C-terminal target domain-containing protein n=1 Tax=Marinilabilia rubra TaxID=2162893 RepID=A0A2U2BEA1_9BACT|nr:T9SS type A sorting domain-containing protein [Marinilabilia rubra]PWE01389.1 T9SS C-terminal target domain-containing protein [Marinilabilia rubra]
MKKFYPFCLAIVFFALVDVANGQNQRNESTGVDSQENLLKSSTIYDLIRLKIENQYLFDATVVYYYETFTDEKGPEDSDKMFNSSEKVPEIFTRIGSKAMAINGFSALDGKSYVSVPISVRNRIYDECEISADLADFTDEYDVVLEDKELGQYTNLKTSTYTYSPSVLGIEDDRFVLHLSRSAKVATSIMEGMEQEENIHFSSDYGKLQVSIDADLLAGPGPQGRIEVYSMSGRMEASRPAVAGFNQIELAGGQIYIVSVVVGNEKTTKKLAIR